MRDLKQKENMLNKKEEVVLEQADTYKIIWQLNCTIQISLSPSFFEEI